MVTGEKMRTEEEILKKREDLYIAYRKLTEDMNVITDEVAKPARDIVNTKIVILEWVLGDEYN